MSLLHLPPPDHALSPITGWTRDHWAAVADHLLLSLRPFFSSGRARVLPPGRQSEYGRDSDGLEGFARSFLILGFRLKGEGGEDPNGFLEWYRAGLIEGTTPGSPERWPRPDEVPQAKVEAASIALVLHLTRPWLWDTLTKAEQVNVIEWLASVVGQSYPPTNWVWFQIIVETFLISVGGPHDVNDIDHALAVHESMARDHGWYSDGAQRAFDYYSGWALQFYPLLWAEQPAAERLGAHQFLEIWRSRLSEYLDDYIHLVGSDGSPVLQGRSLVYRFATAAPLWMGAATGATQLGPGLIRRACSGMLKHFVERRSIDERGLLSLGIYGSWPQMAQSYSGSGSPYWAANGLFGLSLPRADPVWTAQEEPLPVEVGDTNRVIVAPGWLVSGTLSDGIVRVINHGTDHARPDDCSTDAPLYARLGYSSATIPPLTGPSVLSPVDSSISVIDRAGRASHRAGFQLVELAGDGMTSTAVSQLRAHWVDYDDAPVRDHGYGRDGTVVSGPTITLASVIHGAWEIRLARVDSSANASPVTLRFSGWPIAWDAAETHEQITRNAAAFRVGALRSYVRILSKHQSHIRPEIHFESGTSPLGQFVSVPWITIDGIVELEIVAAAVSLSRSTPSEQPRVAYWRNDAERPEVVVQWPDGTESAVRLPPPRPPLRAG